jgi:dihydrofolate reductase
MGISNTTRREVAEMRHVILQEFLSVDGLAAGPGDSVAFVPAANSNDQSFGDRQREFLDSIDTILLGRKTYQMFSGYWPKVPAGPEKDFADRLNAIPKVVFSRTLDRAPWGDWDDARVVGTDAAQEVERLKQQPGGDMVIWGSISLAQILLKAGVIDDIQLVICPVVLGEGRRLFDGQSALGEMTLRHTRSFDRGSVLLSYTPAMVPASAP